MNVNRRKMIIVFFLVLNSMLSKILTKPWDIDQTIVNSKILS